MTRASSPPRFPAKWKFGSDVARGDADTSPILALCEHEDDISLVRWVANRASVTGIEFRHINGWPGIDDLLLAHIKDPVFGGHPPVIAAIVDGDTDPVERRKQIGRRFKRLAPASQLFVYLLPDNDGTGELEDLFLAACTDTALLDCADKYADCVEQQPANRAKRSKLRYQAYAAPRRFERRAIQHSPFDSELDYAHPHIQKLAAFLAQCRAGA